MIPMSLALESGSQMEAPLGRAVIGGLLVSTFGTLLLLPALFTIVMGDRKFVSPSVHPDDPDSPHFDEVGASDQKASAEHPQAADKQEPDKQKDEKSKRDERSPEGQSDSEEHA